MRTIFFRLLVAKTLFATALPALAYDVNDKLSIGGVLAAAGQCQIVSARLPSATYDEDGSLDEFDNECRGAMPFQPEISFHPNDDNEFFFKLGFAAGNGLNPVSPWTLAPWAADLEDDVKDINGRNLDYLLTGWYRHTFNLTDAQRLHATVGRIDATDYLDGVAYANDEYTQFMNEALTNAANVFLPSYDIGAALEWEIGPWALRGVYMNVGENEAGNNFDYYGLELGVTLDSALGEGHYKVLVDWTSEDFVDPSDTTDERRKAVLLSFDQGFGEALGAFLRFGWQADQGAVNYKAIYSGGLNFDGSAWGREPDNIGIAYAYLPGGNLDIERTDVFEVYYRLGLNDHIGITADLQYMKDELITIDPLQENPEGWIVGLRLAAEF
ncbi:MAG: carbohydrate porin [Gammaproteobacteria bacterium]|jgi:porin|nr:carbohydrate porin [Gammaproteobacteria bacterium]